MKRVAHCGACNKEFPLKDLRTVPWPQKNPWYTVGEQKYKFCCPHCSAYLLPETEMDASAISQIKQIKLAYLSAIAIIVVLLILWPGLYVLNLMLIAVVAKLPVFYKMAKYKTGNILGSGTLKMMEDNNP